MTSPCTDQNITVYTDSHTDTARVQLADGVTYTDLPAGTYTYETLTAQNMTCITRFNVFNNKTGNVLLCNFSLNRINYSRPDTINTNSNT